MDVNRQPDIDFPVAIVVINQPGTAPAELETQITQRVESAVRVLQGIDEIQSNVTEGSSTTVVQLDIGTPIDRTANDLREAINQIRANLPDGILEPPVFRLNTTDNEVASFTAIATDMTVEDLSWYVDNTMSKELLAVPSLTYVVRNGDVSREIRVILDLAKVQSYGLTASQVNQQLRQVNFNAAGGRAEFRAPSNRCACSATLPTPIRSTRPRSRSATAAPFALPTSPGSEISTASCAVRRNGMAARCCSTAPEYAETQYKTALHALIEGSLLAVVVFLFLSDWRATLISALVNMGSLLLAPLGGLVTLWLLNYPIWMPVYIGMLMPFGIVTKNSSLLIDFAIEEMEKGVDKLTAIADAGHKRAQPIVMTTIAMVAGMVPTALALSGDASFRGPMGVTVIGGLILSTLLTLLMIVPASFSLAIGVEKWMGPHPCAAAGSPNYSERRGWPVGSADRASAGRAPAASRRRHATGGMNQRGAGGLLRG